MAPLPPNSTRRFFLDYTTGRYQHTFQMRTANGITAAGADAVFADFVNAFLGLTCAGWAVLGGRVQEAGSNITLPANFPLSQALSSPNVSDPLPENQEPRAVTYVGRGAVSGRRVRVAVYGLLGNTPNRYRYLATGVPGDVTTDVLTALRDGGGNDCWLSIGGDVPYWLDYADVNYNSYWEAAVRG